MPSSNEDKKRRDRRLSRSEKASDRKADALLTRGKPQPAAPETPGAQDPETENAALRHRLRTEPIEGLKPKVNARAKPSR